MTKETQKKVWNQTNILFLIGIAASGITYRLYAPEINDKLIVLILTHVSLYIACYLFSYFGYKTAIRKQQIKE
jgi:hypothetical protein